MYEIFEEGKKKSRTANGLVDEHILSLNPVFAMRSNYKYLNTIINACVSMCYNDHLFYSDQQVLMVAALFLDMIKYLL